jgi:hypothetical protein
LFTGHFVNAASSAASRVIYAKEEKPPKGLEPIEWFLMTDEEVNSGEQAFEKAR